MGWIDNARAKLQAKKEEHDQRSYNKAVMHERREGIREKMAAHRATDPRVKARAARREKLKEIASTVAKGAGKTHKYIYGKPKQVTKRRKTPKTKIIYRKAPTRRKPVKRKSSGGGMFGSGGMFDV